MERRNRDVQGYHAEMERLWSENGRSRARGRLIVITAIVVAFGSFQHANKTAVQANNSMFFVAGIALVVSMLTLVGYFSNTKITLRSWRKNLLIIFACFHVFSFAAIERFRRVCVPEISADDMALPCVHVVHKHQLPPGLLLMAFSLNHLGFTELPWKSMAAVSSMTFVQILHLIYWLLSIDSPHDDSQTSSIALITVLYFVWTQTSNIISLHMAEKESYEKYLLLEKIEAQDKILHHVKQAMSKACSVSSQFIEMKTSKQNLRAANNDLLSAITFLELAIQSAPSEVSAKTMVANTTTSCLTAPTTVEAGTGDGLQETSSASSHSLSHPAILPSAAMLEGQLHEKTCLESHTMILHKPAWDSHEKQQVSILMFIVSGYTFWMCLLLWYTGVHTKLVFANCIGCILTGRLGHLAKKVTLSRWRNIGFVILVLRSVCGIFRLFGRSIMDDCANSPGDTIGLMNMICTRVTPPQLRMQMQNGVLYAALIFRFDYARLSVLIAIQLITFAIVVHFLWPLNQLEQLRFAAEIMGLIQIDMMAVLFVIQQHWRSNQTAQMQRVSLRSRVDMPKNGFCKTRQNRRERTSEPSQNRTERPSRQGEGSVRLRKGVICQGKGTFRQGEGPIRQGKGPRRRVH